MIHSRFGVPNENYKSTVFKVTNDEKDADSFIQYTYHSGQIESASLPNIYDIDLKKCHVFGQPPYDGRSKASCIFWFIKYS